MYTVYNGPIADSPLFWESFNPPHPIYSFFKSGHFYEIYSQGLISFQSEGNTERLLRARTMISVTGLTGCSFIKVIIKLNILRSTSSSISADLDSLQPCYMLQSVVLDVASMFGKQISFMLYIHSLSTLLRTSMKLFNQPIMWQQHEVYSDDHVHMTHQNGEKNVSYVTSIVAWMLVPDWLVWCPTVCSKWCEKQKNITWVTVRKAC